MVVGMSSTLYAKVTKERESSSSNLIDLSYLSLAASVDRGIRNAQLSHSTWKSLPKITVIMTSLVREENKSFFFEKVSELSIETTV